MAWFQLILVVALVSAGLCEDCTWLDDWNKDCVKLMNCDPKGHDLYMWEDCKSGSDLLYSNDPTALIEPQCNVLSLSDDIVKLKTEEDAENFVEPIPCAFTADATMTFINILDVNEYIPLPVDGSSFSDVKQEENVAVEDMVHFDYKDDDYNESGSLTGEFVDETLSDIFSLSVEPKADKTTFKIGTKELDFETMRSQYILVNIISTDTRGMTLNSTHTVLLTVIDVGDTPPIWTKVVYSKEFDEGVAGRTVFSVEAHDGDAGINNQVKYSISGGNKDGIFDIDPESGEVTNIKDIDRETLETTSFVLEILAQEYINDTTVAPDPSSSSMKTTVYIKDIDDNVPKFNQKQYDVSMNELNGANSPLQIDMFVFDMDEGDNGTYTVTSDHKNYLEIHPEVTNWNSSLSFIALWREEDNIFDCEKLDGPILIQLKATEKANPDNIGTTTLNISLVDINDNNPTFDDDCYNVDVSEIEQEGYSVVNATATDEDVSDDFGTASIIYILKSCEELSIDASTGEISLSQNNSLDFETKPQVTCVIEAHDSYDAPSYRSGISMINITVLDVVDSPPTLDKLPSEMRIHENKESGTALTPSITGHDKDADADIIFQIDWNNSSAWFKSKPVDISKVNKWFDIETKDEGKGKYSGVIKVGKESPDREVADSIELSIIIIDRNTAFNNDRDKGFVTITIIDENDCPPEFDELPSALSVEENADDGFLIAIVSVHDPDESDSFTFDISNASFVDLIQDETDPSRANLMVANNSNIDREAMSAINVTLFVYDNANHETPLEISITIIDLNDNSPIMNEGICDQTRNIDEISGLETIGNNPTENGTLVWTFIATDADAGALHSEVGYYKMNELLPDEKNKRLPFIVNEITGELTVFIDPSKGKILDREGSPDDYFWDVYVVAYDHCGELFCKVRESKSCHLTINVNDVNDNAPTDFQWSSYPKPITVNEFQREGEFAKDESGNEYTIFATDADEEGNVNTILNYTIVSVTLLGGTEDMGLFRAVTKNQTLGGGKIQYYCKLVATKDFTGLEGEYVINVMAEDAGTPPLSGMTNISLIIEDSNDHSPDYNFFGCLNETNHVITMAENTPAGAIGECYIPGYRNVEEINIQVIDDDKGDNKKFDVSIDPEGSSGGNQTKAFGIRLKPGSDKECELYTTEPIDRESGNLYNLSLYAKDHGDPPLDSFSWVQIVVTNKFEHDPFFCLDKDFCSEIIYIPENDTEATAEFLNATDLDDVGVPPTDIHNYDIVYYATSGGNEKEFIILKDNETTLQVTKALDRETIDRYELYIDTFNKGGTPDPIPEPVARNFTLYLTIMVLDVNDNAPEFEDVVIGSFTKDYQKDNIVATAQAYDKDLNETLTYASLNDFVWNDGGPSVPPPIPFRIENAENDTIKILLNFDPADVNSGYCTFTITCTDKNNVHTTENAVKVFVITVDYMVPVFFANTEEEVESQRDNIESIFGDVFKYRCIIDSVDGSTTKEDNALGEVTVKMHFIDDVEDVLVDKNEILAKSLDAAITEQLFTRLNTLNLNLEKIGDHNIGGGGNEDVTLMLEIVLAVSSFVLVSLLVMLMTAYYIRTTKLKRQVKVLTTTTFGSRSSELNRLGTEMAVVPGSNKFLGEGSNPLYNLPDDQIRNDDGDSVDSGDSVLVGIEENPDFRKHGFSQSDSENGFDNRGFGRSIDDVSAPSPFAGGARINPLLEMGNGTGDDVDLSDAIHNYEMFVRNGSSSSEDKPGIHHGDIW